MSAETRPAIVLEARRQRGQHVAWAILVVVLLVLAAPFLSATVRRNVQVRFLAARLDSSDPMVRAETRKKLLEIGRPAIDSVYPDLIAGEVEEESVQDTLVVVARQTGTLHASSVWVLDDVLGVKDHPSKGGTVFMRDEIVCPTARLLRRMDARRELIVIATRSTGLPLLRLAVSLDDDLAPAIIEAVKARLAARKP